MVAKRRTSEEELETYHINASPSGLVGTRPASLGSSRARGSPVLSTSRCSSVRTENELGDTYWAARICEGTPKAPLRGQLPLGTTLVAPDRVDPVATRLSRDFAAPGSTGSGS